MTIDADLPASAREHTIPKGFEPLPPRSPFSAANGPFYIKEPMPAGEAVLAFRVLEKHLNSARIVHGGMLATFADMLLASAIELALGHSGFTARLVSDYAGPARLGEWVEGRARMTRATKSLAFVEGKLSVGPRLVLDASAVFALVKKRL